MPTTRAKHIVDVLRRRAERDGERPAYTFLARGERPARALTYAQLDARARAVAAALREICRGQQRALMVYSPGLEFVEAFWGCLYARVIAVPAYAPGQGTHGVARFEAIAGDCAPQVVLSTREHIAELRRAGLAAAAAVPMLATDDVPDDAARSFDPEEVQPRDVAMLQYSSGSTAAPKGVILSHRNILANQAMVKAAFRHSETSTFAGWLPFFHDMGLFGNIVQPLYVGAHSVLMAPMSFLQKPVRWLRAVSTYRAHTSGGPNFAYEYCLRRVSAEDKAGLDLSCWTRAFNGAEKPRPETMRRFAAAFAECGFREEAFYPCYGMAEAVLFVTGRDPVERPLPALAVAGEGEAPATPEPGLVHASSGRGWLRQRLAIVDPATHERQADGQVGEIWVQGPHVGEGYWAQPVLTKATFGAYLAGRSAGPFLRTGDLGFVKDGELFVTGRLKDLVILRGQNFHPEDIEAVIEGAVAALEPGHCAAFGAELPAPGEAPSEQLVVVVEVGRAERDLDALAEAVASAVARAFGLAIARLVLARRGAIPKTSSGKIQRARCRERFLTGAIEALRTVVAEPEAAPLAPDPDLRVELRALDAEARVERLIEALAARLRVLLPGGALPERLASLVGRGLDSVRAIELKQWLEAALAVPVAAAELFAADSLEDLAHRLAARLDDVARDDVDVATAGPPDPAAVSVGQEALVFEHEKAPSSAADTISVALRLTGRLDRERLTATLRELSRRHPQLTAAFTREGGRVRQRRGEPARPEFVDASSWSEARRAEEVNRRAHLPFDLATGGLRCVVFAGARDSVLLAAVHHALIDLASLELLVRDLARLHAAGSEGDAVSSAGYADFVAWQAAYLKSPRGAAALGFWRETLAGRVVAGRAPFAPARAERGERRGRQQRFRLGRDETVAVVACAAGEQVTPAMVLLGAYAALLARFGRAGEVLVGVSVAGRPEARFADVLGYFANILPLPLTVDEARPCGVLLRDVKRLLSAALDHQHYPYSLLVERLAAEGRLERGALVRHAFTFATERGASGPLGLLLGDETARVAMGDSLEASGFPLERRMAPFDLTLMVVERDAGFDAAFTFDEEAVDAEAVPVLVQAYRELLAALARGAREPLARLALGTAGAVACSVAAPVAPEPVLARFGRQARARADAVALVAGDAQVTYGELDRRARRLGAHLRGLGVGPESVVAVHCPRGVELVVGVLGALAAGAAYLPVEDTLPAERLRLLVDDAGAELVLTVAAYVERCAGARARPLRLDADWDALAGAAPRAAPAPPVESLAYIIYTSGSTGRPKGVGVSHASLARLFDAARACFEFGPDDTWSLFHSVSFDFSVWELWGALVHGARLTVLDRPTTRDPERACAHLLERQVSVLSVTPSAFSNLLPALVAAGGGARAAALRYVVFGGEALQFDRLKAWFERPPAAGAGLVNMYGITETTIHTTWLPVAPPHAAEGGDSAIGRPLDDVDLHIVDAALRRLPDFALGEIAVGGAGLARGYLGRPALTAERFVPDPFGPRAGARLYRSGDLAYRRGAGDLRYVGRADAQVKVRGHRVEPGEIEAHLRACPGVEWALVPPPPAGDDGLTAYLMGAVDLNAARLREHLLRRVPEYLVPARFVRLDALPTNENGKVDLARLRAATRALPAGETYAPPRDEIERALARIWAEALGVERVGLDDNWFALGGDSIRSIRVIARAREQGLTVELSRLLAGQTIRSLSAGGASAAAAAEAVRSGPFELLTETERARLPAGLEDAYPVARLLQGLIFHSQYSEDYQVYVTSLHVRAAWDAGRFVLALQATLARHPFLRSAIDAGGGGEPLQLVYPRVDVPLTFEDLRDLPADEQERRVHATLEAEKWKRIDWGRAPLLRFLVQRRAEDAFQITLADPYLDGWCVALLLRELLQGYGALARGETLEPRAPTQIGQRHLVELERRALANEATRAFWRRHLDGCPDALLSRAHYKQAPAQAMHARRTLVLVRERLEALEALGREAGVPLRSVLLAAHFLVLARVLGRDDVVGGVIQNGRPEERDGAEAIGSFLNAAPFRVAVDAGESWVTYLRRLFASERELLPHRRFPLAELRRLRGAELRFDTVFNYTHFHALDELRDAGQGGIVDLYASEQTFFPLTVHFNRALLRPGLELLLDYNCHEVSAAQVASLAEAYLAVLARLTEDPHADGGVGRAASIIDGRLFPPPAEPPPRADPERVPDSALALIDAVVAARPDALALVDGEQSLSYARLAACAGALADALEREQGVRHGDLVGLHATHSTSAVVSMLALLRLGAAYVPLDPAAPAERLRFVIADCGLRCALTEQDLAPAVRAHGLRPIEVDRFLRDRARAPRAARRRPAPDPDDLAYVIYTSGSTGRPKGVGISQRSVANLALCARAEYGLTAGERVLQFCTLEFDISVEEIFMCLGAGGTLVLRPRDLLAGYDEFHAACARHAVTCLNVPTAFWSDWTRELAAGRRFDLDALRTVIIAGEAMRPELAAQWLARVPQESALVNTYGPTETTVKATILRVTRESLAAAGGAQSPIGRGFGNAVVRVLDRRLRPTAPGVYGELHVGGLCVARGYLGRPGLTAERFTPDPDGPFPGARRYRTGDVAFIGRDGAIQFVGRIDRQVKLRGFRVELEEVEAALLDCPGVRQAAVVADSSGGGAAVLRAWVQPEGRWDATRFEHELRRRLLERLPAYMVPATLTVVESLPTTQSGKLDRNALARVSPRAGDDGPRAATPDGLVATIAGVLGECLGATQVEADDEFFALGGDSLAAMRVAARLRARLGCAASVRDVFENPRVDALARALARRLETPDAADEGDPAVAAEPRLSFAQERLWMAEQLAPEAAVLNIPAAVALRGPFHACAFEAAVGEVQRRHAALRTRVVLASGRPVPVCDALPGARVARVDLRGLDLAQRGVALAAAQVELARARFDLERDPPLRLALVRLDAREHRLVLVLHHAAADGWSISLLIGELLGLYARYARGLPSDLPEPPIQYADFARRQRAALRGERRRQLAAYWQHALAGMPEEVELPRDRPRPAYNDFRGARHDFELEPALLRALGRLGREEGATPFVMLLAAYAALLHRRSGQDDLVVGTPVSSRDWADTEGLIGVFVNQLVLRVDLSGRPTWRELLRRVRRSVLAAHDHRDLPFEELVALLRPRRSAAGLPLVQTVFAFRDRPWQDFRIEGLELQFPELHNGAAKYDLEVQLVDAGERGLRGYFEYNLALFEEATIRGLAAEYGDLLRALVAQPDAPCAAAPVDLRDAPAAPPAGVHGLN